VHLRQKPLGSGICAADLAIRTDGFSGAEIESVCRRAALCAVRRAVEGAKGDPEPSARVLIEVADVEAALEELEKRA